jgi:hypothetical protein
MRKASATVVGVMWIGLATALAEAQAPLRDSQYALTTTRVSETFAPARWSGIVANVTLLMRRSSLPLAAGPRSFYPIACHAWYLGPARVAPGQSAPAGKNAQEAHSTASSCGPAWYGRSLVP